MRFLACARLSLRGIPAIVSWYAALPPGRPGPMHVERSEFRLGEGPFVKGIRIPKTSVVGSKTRGEWSTLVRTAHGRTQAMVPRTSSLAYEHNAGFLETGLGIVTPQASPDQPHCSVAMTVAAQWSRGSWSRPRVRDGREREDGSEIPT
jgi:hypothetical protein